MWGANVVLGAIAVILLVLNHREAAFDPLDPVNYRLRSPASAGPAARSRPGTGSRRGHGRWPSSSGCRGSRSRFRASWTATSRGSTSGHLILVLVAFWSIFVLVEFLDLFDDIQQNKVKGTVVIHYYAFHSPFIVHLVAPVAVLVATLMTFGILSRRNEITAMKAGGLSLYRATFPTVALGVVVEPRPLRDGRVPAAPHEPKGPADFNVIKGRPPETSSYLDRRWILGTDGRFYNYEYLRGPGREDHALRAVRVRRRRGGLGPSEPPLRGPGHLERRVVRPGAGLAALHVGCGGLGRAVPGLRPGPHARDRAPELLQTRGAGVGHHAVREPSGSTSLARDARARRRQAEGAAPQEARLTPRRRRHDPDRHPLRLHRGPKGGPLRDRHQHPDRDRLLDVHRNLRGRSGTTRSCRRCSRPGRPT